MGKILGNDYRLWIYDGVSAYHEVKGQTSTKVGRQAASIDTSTKDDFPYGTQAPGLKTLTLDLEIYPDLPDASGYGRMETIATGNGTAEMVQIRKGGSSGGDTDVVFEASMYIGNFDTDMPKNDVVKCTFQLTLQAAPTVDALK